MKELPDIIGDLIQLRYLDVSYNARIQRLPESLCDLYNLQALRLWGCQLQSFPQGMSKLINLRHLHVEDEIISKIYEVGKLISLQELSAFKVPKNHGNKLAELSGLTQLHGTLRITNLENVGSKEEASKAKLHGKQYLEALELEWAADQVSSLEHELLVSEEVLLGLQPHHFLKSLTIRGYGGATVPSWLDVKMLLNLGTLKLENCRRLEGLSYIGQLPYLKVLHMKRMPVVKQISHELCGEKIWFPRLEVLVLKNMPALEKLPSLGQLPCLKVLRIQGLPAVKKIAHGLFDSTCQREGFPRLEELVLRDMPAWEEWSWAEREELFSCLHRLKIEQCPKLKCLPPVPYSLMKLELWQAGLTGLPGLCKGIGGGSSTTTASLSLLHIIKCPNLRNLEEGLLSNHLPHINAIRIWDCAELLWLPVKRFREFTTLEYLSIHDCPKLMSMTLCEENDLLLPPSIKVLELGDCGNLGKSLPGCLHNLSSLTHLGISNCPHMVSFPREVMLHLKELGIVWIKNCDGLRSIEGLLLNEGDEQGEILSLLELSVDNTALLELSLIKNTLPLIHSLRITSSPQKVMFDWEEQELMHSLTALRRLEFLSCKNLQSLPTELHTLPSLRALVVSDCPQIQSLPEKGLPTLLTDLGFDYCHSVLTAQLAKHLAEMKSSGRFHPVYA
ncbi:NB-ARC domain [Musa troglodytarum]|uniref:NB-ARC domain n=1 Tax=Musa troglodytarum TaxID=320322 RepID=A0A9E7KA62_9LILI|nr:NB-ARC domain [Musa troglodytarum]